MKTGYVEAIYSHAEDRPQVEAEKSVFAPGQAVRDGKRADYSQLPIEGLQRIAGVFSEGEQKYGRDNWKKGGEDYEYDAANHAFEHLKRYVDCKYNGGVPTGEDDLAKVGWWVLTQCWHDAHKQ